MARRNSFTGNDLGKMCLFLYFVFRLAQYLHYITTDKEMRDNKMRIIKRDGQIWRVFIECLNGSKNKAIIDNVFTREVRIVEAFPKSDK